MSDIKAFMERWQTLLHQLIDTSVQLMEKEAAGGPQIRGLLIKTLDEEEWDVHGASTIHLDPPSGMLS